MPCSFTAMDQSCHDRLFSFSLCTDIDRGCNGKLSLFFIKKLTFQKSCLHILNVSCVDEIEQGFSQKTACRVSQHISQPGWHFHTLKIMIKWLSYQESTSKNFISREWRVVKTPIWLGAENTGLTGLAVPIKRAPDSPESWLASPRVCPVIRRGLY